jgi:hypothetical protein
LQFWNSWRWLSRIFRITGTLLLLGLFYIIVNIWYGYGCVLFFSISEKCIVLGSCSTAVERCSEGVTISQFFFIFRKLDNHHRFEKCLGDFLSLQIVEDYHFPKTLLLMICLQLLLVTIKEY